MAESRAAPPVSPSTYPVMSPVEYSSRRPGNQNIAQFCASDPECAPNFVRKLERVPVKLDLRSSGNRWEKVQPTEPETYIYRGATTAGSHNPRARPPAPRSWAIRALFEVTEFHLCTLQTPFLRLDPNPSIRDALLLGSPSFLSELGQRSRNERRRLRAW